MKRTPNNSLLPSASQGFIALMSVLIISLTLLGITFTTSTNGFFSRFAELDAESKRIGLSLAESCVNTALLRIAQNPSYQPAVGGDSVTVGPNTCIILSISYNRTNWSSSPYQEIATISTQAQYRGTWSNMSIVATIQNPSYLQVIRGTLTVITHVTNDNGGAKQAGNFTVNVSGGNPSIPSSSGSEVGTIIYIDGSTSYTVSQPSQSSYAQITSAGCSGSIAAGASATCTITENDIATTGKLTVIANVINSYGGTEQPSSVSLFLDGAPVQSGALNVNLIPGNHTVTANTMLGYDVNAWGSPDSNCAGAIGAGSVTINAGDNKTCEITFQDNAPAAPTCADTVMMLDRTISMFGDPNAVPNEKIAAESLLDLYGRLATPPLVGAGRFGKDAGVSAEIMPGGSMTSVYGTHGGTGSSGPNAPTSTVTPSQWNAPSNAFMNDTLYATDSTNGHQQTFGNYGLNVPAGATITGVEVVVDGMVSPTQKTANINLDPLSAGNYNTSSWSTNTGSKNINNKVNAVSDGNTSTYITATNNATQTFTLDTSTIPAGATINSVTFTVSAEKTGSNTPTLSLRIEKGTSGGNQNDTAIANLDTSYAPYSTATMTKDPFTNAAWTLSELSMWGFGVNKTNTNGTVRVAEMYVTVNYTYTPTVNGSVGVNLSWNNGTNWTSTKTANLTNTGSAQALSVDTWGHTWATGDIANGKFLLRLTNTSANGITTSINYSSVKIDYAVPSTGLYVAIESGLNDVNSWTNIGDAINTGSTELQRVVDGKKKVLILISDGTNVNLDSTNRQTNGSDNASAVSWAQTASDNAKKAGINVYTIHFGNANTVSPFIIVPRDFIAGLANGTLPIVGHQPGSQNNAGTSLNQATIDAENNDNDNFYISPTSAEMASIFQAIGKAVCPALATPPPPPPPTTASIIIITNVINDNGGTNQPIDFTSLVTANNPVPVGSPAGSYLGYNSPGYLLTVTPGAYRVDQAPLTGGTTSYTKILGIDCSGTIVAGGSKTCSITDDDIQAGTAMPVSPPTLSNININSWQENP